MPSERRIPSLRPPRLRRDRGRASLAAIEHAPESLEPRFEELEGAGLRWIKLARPTDTEQEWLGERFEFHPLDLEDVVSRNQRPKLDLYDDYMFIVLHFPVFDPEAGRLTTGELDLFVGPGYLVSIPNRPLQPVDYLFERCRRDPELRQEIFSKGAGYLLYRIVDDSFDYCFPMLRKIGNKLDSLEEQIFTDDSSDVVREISNVRQEIINFRRVIRPGRPVIAELEKVKRRYLAPDLDLEIYFDDVGDAQGRIWDLLENYKEVVEALGESNESVVSSRVNDILRVLTSISVIVLPLTLLASVWGMNVGVPGQGSGPAFWIVIGSMIALLVAMVAWFRGRGWL